MKIQPVILAAVETPIPPTSNSFPPIAEWGLVGAVAYLCVQKAWESFSRKEQAESALIQQLVTGLRENQIQMLGQMSEMVKLSHTDIRDLKEAVLQLTSITRSEMAEISRQQSQAIAEIKDLVRQLEKECGR